MSTGGLRILITNNTLGDRAGSELYVRDLALGLLRRGHRPVVYSTILGEVAELLRQATVPVVDDLNALTVTPDVIHGQHHLETMMAVQHFPQVPAVYVCHGWLPWEELPPVFPSIRRYVAVDDLCAERLHTTKGIDPAHVRTIYNGVDLERFQPRESLPDHPRSALIFSNYTGIGSHSYEAIRSACLSYGITHVETAGTNSGQIAHTPEALLRNYDVVFAKARCALEAMAVGCATVVADYAGLGGLVTTRNVQTLRRLNFGMRTMQASPITEATVLAELEHYSKRDAAEVSDWIRLDAPFQAVVDGFLTVYREALEEHIEAPAHAVSMAAGSYLRLLSPRLKSLSYAEMRAQSVSAECLALKSQLEEVQERERTALLAHAAAEARADSASAEHSAIKSQLEDAQERERTALLKHAAQEQENTDLHARLLATEAEASLSAATLQSLERKTTNLQAGFHSLERDSLELRVRFDEAQRVLHEIHRSRAWRAVTAYRRLRAWLA